MTSVKKIRTRIAPSPTGSLHVGTIRVALFNWLFARKNGGEFIVRVEDTDKERSEKKYEEEILTGLKWVGLDWEEGPDKGGPHGPYRQSERREVYRKEIKRLFTQGQAYYCFCTKEELDSMRQVQLTQGMAPKYSKKCRTLKVVEVEAKIKSKMPSVIRFKTPEDQRIVFNDVVRGGVQFESDIVGDIVIARSTDDPLFILAGVIDDYYMEITHVIRGEDHLPNTPKQILLQEALGFEKPVYAHLPLVLSSDRKKLSKRYAETSFLEYKKQGYLPEAILNFIALLGWHPSASSGQAPSASSGQAPSASSGQAPSANKEIFTKEELIKEFDLKRVQKAGAIFNIEKLDWINFEHIKNLKEKELMEHLKYFVPKEWLVKKDFFKKVLSIEKNRMKKLIDFPISAKIFFEMDDYRSTLLTQEGKTKKRKSDVYDALLKAKKTTEELREDEFNIPDLVLKFNKIVNPKDRGAVLWPLRVALSGREDSPGPYEILSILGKEESLKRIENAVQKLKNA